METQMVPYELVVLVCTNSREEGKNACANRGSGALHLALRTAVEERGLKGRVRVSSTGCLGKCSLGPNLLVYPDGTWYSGVTEADLPELIDRHLGYAPTHPAP